MIENATTETGLVAQSPVALPADPQQAAPAAVPWMSRIEEHSAWPVLSRLAITMTAEIPLRRFRIQDLLGLAEGQVFESVSSNTEDVPLRVGDVQLGWTEFEVVDQRIALRVTRLV